MSFEQALTLDVVGDSPAFLQQPVKIGAGHADKPPQSVWSQGRRVQVSVYDLPHALHPAEIDLPPRDRDALGRGGDGRADYCSGRSANPQQISFGQVRQLALQGDHVVAEDVSERCVEG